MALLLVVGVAAGVGLSFSFFGTSTPVALKSASPDEVVPVTVQPFDDPQPVDIELTIQPSLVVTVPRSGTVTTWSCSPGLVLESGKSSLGIDGASLLNLATSMPLWRDIPAGASGPDVQSLKNEMVRLGLSVAADGPISRGELGVLREYAKSQGVQVGESLSRDVVVWLPGPVLNVESCSLALGAIASSDTGLAEVSGGISLEPIVLPVAGLPGPRSLDAFGSSFALGGAGELPAELDDIAIRGSSAFREAVANSPDATVLTIKGRLVLQTAVSVASVPATAVFVQGDGASCVFTKSDAVGVQVVGSEFGSSFVLFEDAAPEMVESFAPRNATSCS